MPISSPCPPIEIPDIGLYEGVIGNLSPEDESRVAIVDTATGVETTYAELRDHIHAAAGALHARGVGVGDVVALHCVNSLAFVVAAHATWKIGGVLSPISSLATPSAIAEQLKDSHATLLLTLQALGEGAAHAAAETGLGEKQVVHLDGPNGLRSLLSEGHAAPEVEFDAATHVAALPYSSGTTGLPKGVQLTHRNLVANVRQAQARDLVLKEDTVYGVLPFFHIYGLTALANVTLAQRGCLVTAPKFDIAEFLRAHQDHNVSFSFIAPPIAVLLAKHPAVAEADLSSLRAFFSGAATLDTELAHAVEERLRVPVQQGYGMTETSPMTHANQDPHVDRGSIGEVVANTEFKLVDTETGEEIPLPRQGRSDLGELWVRGPQIMKGYLNRPEETALALPGDGWLRTGDIAEMDPEGHVFIVDRLKELIKYKGYQVPPAELESLLLTHPNVDDVGVVGVIRDGEEIPKAFVVPTSGAALSEKDIMDFIAERIAPYKKVREVEFISAIPKSATGKILRRELKQR